MNLRWPESSALRVSRLKTGNSTAIDAHRYVLSSVGKTKSVTFTAHFSPEKCVASLPKDIQERNVRDWAQYWREGGFVDLTNSSNPNATELQRRIITSQYHVRVNSATKGQSPQESGLMNNGWYGMKRSDIPSSSFLFTDVWQASSIWRWFYGITRTGRSGANKSILTTSFRNYTKLCCHRPWPVQKLWAGMALAGQR